MYPILLSIHNIVRWAALLLGVIVFVRALFGLFGRRGWEDLDRKLGVYFTSAIDIQLLLGLLLYLFFSPITKQVFSDFGGAMSNSGLRFFAIEHAFSMILALVFAHLGSALSKKASEPRSKHLRAALWFGLAVLLMLVGMPWDRPLLPGL
jgi:hypothetical protein